MSLGAGDIAGARWWRSGRVGRQRLRQVALMAKIAPMVPSSVAMKSMSAKEAKNAFGLLLDTARAEPVAIVKHGRRVAVVVSAEEYDRLADDRAQADQVKNRKGRKKNEGG